MTIVDPNPALAAAVTAALAQDGPAELVRSNSGLVLAAGCVVLVLIVVTVSGRPFRPPRFVADASPESVDTVQTIWERARHLEIQLSHQQGTARSIEQELQRLRAHSGMEAQIRPIQNLVSRLQVDLAASTREAGALADSLSG